MQAVALHRPGPPLAEFVDLIWVFEQGPQPWAQERLLPQGTVELVVDLAAPASDDVVSGPQSKFFLLDTTRPQNLVGVHFKPGGAFPFLDPPLYELRNSAAPLDALWGPLAREMRERLGDARTRDEQFSIVEQALLTQAAGRLSHHAAVAYALRAFTRIPHVRTVAAVSHEVGLSQRRFIERFTTEVGLTPKVFCRVQRFQAAIRRAHATRGVNWSALAADCGYFDQAHFIHDFEAFSGLTPAAWAAQRTEHVNHVPIRD